MAKKWYYAVKIGRKAGVYNSWEETEEQVKGFAGAVFKKFPNFEEAEQFVSGTECHENSSNNAQSSVTPAVEIYVDGSYNKDHPSFYSCGVVILKDDQIVKTISERASGSAASMRNVAGELLAACKAFEYCYNNGISKAIVYHDYEGIGAWCTGKWKTNNRFTQNYKAYYERISKFVDISFIKVTGHSNNKYNDLADELAKQALESA